MHNETNHIPSLMYCRNLPPGPVRVWDGEEAIQHSNSSSLKSTGVWEHTWHLHDHQDHQLWVSFREESRERWSHRGAKFIHLFPISLWIKEAPCCQLALQQKRLLFLDLWPWPLFVFFCSVAELQVFLFQHTHVVCRVLLEYFSVG